MGRGEVASFACHYRISSYEIFVVRTVAIIYGSCLVASPILNETSAGEIGVDSNSFSPKLMNKYQLNEKQFDIQFNLRSVL